MHARDSPDLSKGTDVLERLVPNAFNKVWDMILARPPKEVFPSLAHTITHTFLSCA